MDMEMLTIMQNTYDAVKDMHPEKRLYYIFDGKLTYQNVLDFCRNEIDCQKEFEFVQPEIYRASLARAAAARIFADADYLNRNSTWTLTYE